MPFFQQAERVIVNGGTLVDITNVECDTRKGEGIKLLLDSYVQREAINDSSARGTLGCHPGTREEYIRNIASWGTGEWETEKRAFLMTGPAGAGKSAIARTCTHRIEEAGNLGASFFFFRPSGWNDPKKFIATIVYQLTTRYPAYRDYIDAVILEDSLVVEKEMDVQFWKLLVKPLQKLSMNGHNLGKGVVIVIDGLDECASVDAQVQIIHLVAASISEQTTPFLWAFFSRPEPPITSAFSSKISANVSWKLPLTLSGTADNDIEAYLRGSFEAIRAKYDIPDSDWPTEDDIRCLISQSAGLFVYPVTAIRYIDGLGKGSSGLEERLCAVSQVDSKSTGRPFSALDQLYILVMMQIPEGVLFDTLSLLHLEQNSAWQKHDRSFNKPLIRNEVRSKVLSCCFALGLSSAAFHVAISNLYSILEVKKSASGEPEDLHFYHKSFLDFLLDPTRSKQYSIASAAVRQHCLETIVRTMGNVADADNNNQYAIDSFSLQAFFTLVEGHCGKLEENLLQQIVRIDWHIWLRPCRNSYQIDITRFIQKVPKVWRRRIIRPSRRPHSEPTDILMQVLATIMPERYKAKAYILGRGSKEGLIVRKFSLYWGETAQIRRFSETESRRSVLGLL